MPGSSQCKAVSRWTLKKHNLYTQRLSLYRIVLEGKQELSTSKTVEERNCASLASCITIQKYFNNVTFLKIFIGSQTVRLLRDEFSYKTKLSAISKNLYYTTCS